MLSGFKIWISGIWKLLPHVGDCIKQHLTNKDMITWWRRQVEIFSALLAFCAGNSPVPGEFPSQRPVTRSFDIFVHLCLDQHLNKPWRRRWFETPSRSFWRHCNELCIYEQKYCRKGISISLCISSSLQMYYIPLQGNLFNSVVDWVTLFFLIRHSSH